MNMTEDVNTQYWYMALRKLEMEGEKKTDKKTKKKEIKAMIREQMSSKHASCP